MKRALFPQTLAILASLAVLATGAAGARIVSGPMLGWQEPREVLIWVETEGAEDAVLAVQPAAGAEGEVRRLRPSFTLESPAGTQVHHFVAGDLEMGGSYSYSVELNGAAVAAPEGSAPMRFSAKRQWEWRGEPPEVHFLIGSCNYHNDPPFDRPGRPYGQDASIFEPMARSGAQFMVWLGDNLYLRESDWTSRSGIYYRWSADRANPALVPLLGAMHHYAVWDDHEFGPNDSSRSYELKDITLEAMNAYFPRRSSGERDNAGIYTRFKQGDAEFFLLDNRYWRDDAAIDPEVMPEKSVLGARQLAWFKNALMESRRDSNVSVRFVAMGSQFLNPHRLFENYSQYPRERQEILDFIAHHRIDGVVFLTGDRHFAELSRLELSEGVVVHDFTSSALTAGPNRRAVTEGANWVEAANPVRVEGTLYTENNYGSVRVAGQRNARVVTFALHDRSGVELWKREHALPPVRR